MSAREVEAGRAMPLGQGTVEDGDDVFIENFITAMLLLLGILAVSASLLLLGYSMIETVYSQQLSMSLLTTLGLAALFLLIGLGSVQLFRRRISLRKKKKKALF